jgi:diguanylate cyclase
VEMLNLASRWQRLWPPVPHEIRDELALLRHARLMTQVPVLYCALIIVVCTAALAAADGAPWVVQIGIPLAVTVVGVGRLTWWIRNRRRPVTPDQARRLVINMIRISTAIAGTCSVWCLLSWTHAAPAQQSYYPLFMAMGSLTTAFCLSVVRSATILNLLLGIVPICTGLLVLGNRMDAIAGSIVLVATAFLVRMILGQHDQLIDLLVLKHQLREQANTDPLTGLLNRRALIAEAEAAFADKTGRPGLALFDLDGFKAINDRHGHAAGDELLVQIAARLRCEVGDVAAVARLGGDEFAIFLADDRDHVVPQLVDRLLAALVPPFALAGSRVSLGASAGRARAPEDGTSLIDLFAAADRALYAVKASRRDQRERRALRSAV